MSNEPYKLAFYSCFYGSDSNKTFSIPPLPSKQYKCYFYTNNQSMILRLKHTGWIAIFDNKPSTDDLIESCMLGKYVKVLPHKCRELQAYDYTCFLDSKYGKVKDGFVEKFIDTYFIKNHYALLLREHWFVPPCIWDEYSVSVGLNPNFRKQQRYILQKDQYHRYIEKQLSTGLHERVDHHSCCGFLIRNMKHPYINQLNNTWYEHIQECGIQDQISFFFVKQIFHDYILPFKELPFTTPDII